MYSDKGIFEINELNRKAKIHKERIEDFVNNRV
jgi:hypothetical protein